MNKEILNPNIEIRNKPQIQLLNCYKHNLCLSFGFYSFEFVRISDCVLRIFVHREVV